ncbi:MAG: HlyD family type I secretion periplasmic adaptor subunit, partial [Pseudomonadota bacterium]
MSGKDTWSVGRPIRFGLFAIVLLIGGFGTWAVRSNIAGAVVASGQLEIDQNRQAIQHPEGGVVAEILVEEGSMVESGELVLRLDASDLISTIAVVRGQLDELRARRARLEAERDGADTIDMPADLLAAAEEDPELAELIRGQRNLFEARRGTLTSAIEQLRRRTEQIAAQVEGLRAQRTAVLRQQEIVEADLVIQVDLRDRGLGSSARVAQLEREAAELLGSLGEIDAGIAQADGRRTEIELQILQRQDERREEAIGQLREVRAEEEELAERERALRLRLERMDMRAPVAGVVYGMTVFGPRSVVRPAEPVMFLVPQGQPLVIATRIDAIHVDQVFVGQAATLRFPVFDQRTTPELFGEVSRVSPDAFTDETTGQRFYEADIVLDPGEMERLGRPLLPGMPVEAFIRTEDRT